MLQQAGLTVIADAEQAKQTGGMVALLPRTADAQNLWVPEGEPIDDLHLTIVYLGEDVTSLDPTEITGQCDYLTQNYGPIQAKVFGYAMFNPGVDETAMVYLVGDSRELSELQRDLKQFTEEHYGVEQHDPFIPHVTVSYHPPTVMDYQGPILFDRLLLSWAGHRQVYPL